MINQFSGTPSKLSNIFEHLSDSFNQLEYGNSDIEDAIKDVFLTYNGEPNAFETFIKNLLLYFDELCEIGIFKYDLEDKQKISMCLGDEIIAEQLFAELNNKINKKRFNNYNNYLKNSYIYKKINNFRSHENY